MKGFTTGTLLTVMAIAILAIPACQPPKDKPADPAKQSTNTETATSAGLTPQDPATIPDKFKHAGFEYYGLADGSELTYEFLFNGTKSVGTQKSVYVGTQDGIPHFRIERSGALSSLGVDDVEVREDGIYLVGVREQQLEKAALALPADVEVGKSWTLEQSLRAGDGEPVSSTGTQKIVKEESITTPAGKFECVVITLDGKMTIKGKTEPVSGSAWYAKGIGTIKLDVNSVDPDGKPIKYGITLISK